MKSQSSVAKQTWLAWYGLLRALWLCAALLPLLANGCSEQEQRAVETEIARAGQTVVVAAQTQSVPLQTQAAQSAGTAAAQGVEAVQTQASLVQQTAVAAAATQAAIFQQTAVASVKTRLPNGGNYQRQFPNITAKDKYLVGAYFYPWYGPGQKHWEQGYAEQPLLGEYDSANLDVINRQIDWATGHGVDFFAASFWGPNSREDLMLRDALLASPLANDIRFAIFYETRAPP